MSTAVLAGMVVLLSGFALLGIWAGRRGVRSVEDLISARDSIGPRQLTATLVASVMGVWILFAAPEAGAGFGIAAVIGYALGQAIPMALYARIGPRIRELMPSGHSLPEYVRVRYGGGAYLLILGISAMYMFIFVAAELTGIAGAFAAVAGIEPLQTVLIVGGAVLIYTAYGGLRASILTDSIQALLILPLLAVVTLVVLLRAGTTAPAAVLSSELIPATVGFWAGAQFGLALVFAIVGAELINQTWWQRIYAGRDGHTVRRSFQTAMLLNGSITFIAAGLGVLARTLAPINTDVTAAGYNADASLFILVDTLAPGLSIVVLFLALLLVISSMDSLFNALASLLTTDVGRLVNGVSSRQLSLVARVGTVAVAIGAMYVSLRAQSVLRLFFLADLLGAAVAVPMLAGLYSDRIDQRGVLLASGVGLVVGLAYFPDLRWLLVQLPGLQGLLPAVDPLYLRAFAGAMLASGVVTLLAVGLTRSTVDLRNLRDRVHLLE
jgi:Na+/proline symporter